LEFGSIGSQVIKPLSVAAGAIAPLAQLASPLMMANPVTAGISKALQFAPSALNVAQGFANLSSRAGAGLT
jgi:hypothetical protein